MHRYTLDQLVYLRTHHKDFSLVELTKRFNRRFKLNKTDSAIRNVLAKRGLRSGRKSGYAKGHKPKPYTQEQIKFIEREYRRLTVPELTKRFNREYKQDRTQSAISSAIRRHGIECVRGLGMSPREVKAIGYERTNSQTGCLMVKIDEPDPYMSSKTRHRHKHKVIWEEANGPVPEGHCLRFLDGDKMNCTLENLEMFTRTESLFMSLLNYDNAPPELKETIRLTAKLKAKAAERKRELLEADNA